MMLYCEAGKVSQLVVAHCYHVLSLVGLQVSGIHSGDPVGRLFTLGQPLLNIRVLPILCP